MMSKRTNQHFALDLYRRAEQNVIDEGYFWEIEWQKNRSFEDFSEQDLLREVAWVILCSGFRESSVRKQFDYISLCFCDWESADEISNNREICISTALYAFGHKPKIRAIAQTAEITKNSGFQSLQQRILDNPISELQLFPFIGPITSWHLAKNLGLNVAKNDRHLLKIAHHCGYEDAHDLCRYLSNVTGEIRSVVDIILWRFATLNPRNYLSIN